MMPTSRSARHLDPVKKAILQFGSSALASSALQPGLSYFEHSGGIIAYRSWIRKNRVFQAVLSDPIAEKKGCPGLIDQFIYRFPDAVFYQISRSTARYLRRVGWHLYPMGTEHHLDLQLFKGTWSTHRSLRRGTNQALRAGVEVYEVNRQDLPVQALLDLSRTWLRNVKKAQEYRFLAQPLSFDHELKQRYFLAYLEGACVGVSVFYPLYSRGEITGYYADIQRVSRTAPTGTRYLMMMSAISAFQSEKIRGLNLGLSPDIFYLKSDAIFPIVYLGARLFYRAIDPVLGLSGLSNYKNRFKAQKRPVYMASKKKVPIANWLGILQHCFSLSWPSLSILKSRPTWVYRRDVQQH